MSIRSLFIFNKYWFFYFITKVFYMLFSILVLSNIVTLGDNPRWMNNVIHIPESISILFNSTMMMDFLGGLSSSLFGQIFGNLPFLLLAFYGIYYPLSKLRLNSKQLLFVLFLLSFPSFGIWSSIAGKEAVGVFFMGVILGYILDLINKERYQIKLIEVFALYLLFVFKPQYSLAVISLLVYIILSNKLHFKSFGKTSLFLFHIIVGLVGFWIFKDIINELSFVLPKHFSLNAGHTRENIIWVEDYDVFFNAPYGMFIGFFGPTFNEVMAKPTLGIVFFESIVIVVLYLYVLVYGLISSIKRGKISIYLFSLLFIGTFWMLFVHYPFGVLNPGSALRYRTNFYGFLVIFIYFLYLKLSERKYSCGVKKCQK